VSAGPRDLPAVSKLLDHPALADASRAAATDAAREVLAAWRDRLRGDNPPASPELDALVHEAATLLTSRQATRLRPVINATGIVLHTNLGRAPLADAAAAAAREAARGYLNLELELDTGKRSSRQDAVRAGVCALTGAESATAVNNCAAATVLTLRALAAGREVVVSRGQLVEIGGGFRIPDILAVSGATLREVGTTNITRLADYEAAITERTGLLLRVHASNFRVRGFTKSVGLADLVELGRRHRVPVVDDIGSGMVFDLTPFGLPGEPGIREGLAAGADLALFSGDKLLGGPQCGVVAGRADLIAKLERDPLMRAFRCDKMTLAALEVTLKLHADPDRARREIPVLRMLTTPLAELRDRAGRLRDALAGSDSLVSVRDETAYAGGGSLPDIALPTAVVAVKPTRLSEGELAATLRRGTPAILARVQAGEVLVDLRAVFDRDFDALVTRLREVLSC
jgi:L-seryl-tRNA(Ser) seleniumtransferase